MALGPDFYIRFGIEPAAVMYPEAEAREFLQILIYKVRTTPIASMGQSALNEG